MKSGFYDVCLIGATGDLAKRKIYPALFNIYLNQKLPDSFLIIGVGIDEMSDVHFQNHVTDSLYTFSRHLINDKSEKQEFVKPFRYCQLDFTNAEGCKKLVEVVQQNEKDQSNTVTSREPKDIPAFNRESLKLLAT